MDNLGMTTAGAVGGAGQQQFPPQAGVTGAQLASGVGQASQGGQTLYTQEQVNAYTNSAVSKRVNELNAAHALEISSLKAQLDATTQQRDAFSTELTGFKQRDLATKLGVPAKGIDFAIYSASQLAVNGKNFETALQEWVSANSGLLQGFLLADQQQAAANSAQNAPAAQVGQVQANNSGLPQGQQAAAYNQTAAQVVTPIGATIATQGQQIQQPYQTVQQNVAPQPVQFVQPSQVQFGQAGFSGAGFGTLGSINTVDAEVQQFLKSKGYN